MTHDVTVHVHDPDPPRGITLADLAANDCRYPFGDREITFCGRLQQEGSSYCPEHHALCWVKPIPRSGRMAA